MQISHQNKTCPAYRGNILKVLLISKLKIYQVFNNYSGVSYPIQKTQALPVRGHDKKIPRLNFLF